MQRRVLDAYEEEDWTKVSKGRKSALEGWLRANDLYHDEYEEVPEPSQPMQVRRESSRLGSNPYQLFTLLLFRGEELFRELTIPIPNGIPSTYRWSYSGKVCLQDEGVLAG